MNEADKIELARWIGIETHQWNGGAVERSIRGHNAWTDYSGIPFNWNDFDYRKKPEPVRGWVHRSHIFHPRYGDINLSDKYYIEVVEVLK
jgi:hypothetical protein